MILCIENQPWKIKLNSPKNNRHNANMHKRKMREALEISRLKTLNETDKTLKVLKRYNGE